MRGNHPEFRAIVSYVRAQGCREQLEGTLHALRVRFDGEKDLSIQIRTLANFLYPEGLWMTNRTGRWHGDAPVGVCAVLAYMEEE